MNLLLDIGNTHTHAGLTHGKRISPHDNFPTASWQSLRAAKWLERFLGKQTVVSATLCSVVPTATRAARKVLHGMGIKTQVITYRNCGLEIDYPKPATIGPDRLANARAGLEHFGAPVVIVDFGTAVTFDIVDVKGRYAGGIIAPGLSAMTDYLHEKPRCYRVLKSVTYVPSLARPPNTPCASARFTATAALSPGSSKSCNTNYPLANCQWWPPEEQHDSSRGNALKSLPCDPYSRSKDSDSLPVTPVDKLARG